MEARMTVVHIPYGAYWATPYAKRQGSLAQRQSLRLAAHVTKHALAKRKIAPDVFDFGVFGTTVPQKGAFYGLPWLMGEAGAGHVGGPTINQACATGVRIMEVATSEIAAGRASVSLAIAGDRTSNGPHIY